MHSTLDWDDLRIVLAVARNGTLSGAARALKVTHSTVFRRLGTIEEKMGVRLFERFRDGYAPTPAGETAAAVAGRVDDEVVALERRLSGQDLRLSGTVRITTTDTLASMVIQHLPALRARHPDLQVDIAISNIMANLTRREADIAVRPTQEPPDLLVGRRIAPIAHAIYASRDYLAQQTSNELPTHLWVGLDDALDGTVIGHWMRENVAPSQVICRLDALPALCDAASAGMGLALLPCYLGDTTSGLRRTAWKPVGEPRSALWLLTHDDLKRTARIRAPMDFLASALGTQRALLDGRRQQSAHR